MFNKKFLIYYVSPLFWYLSMTIGVPLINTLFSGYHSNFMEHAVSITLVSVIITSGLFLLLGRKKRATPKG